MALKPYVVIGAGGGIGKAVCQALYAKDEELLEFDLPEYDMTDSDDIRQLMEELPLDIAGLAYCAGVNYPSWIGDTSEKAEKETFMVNTIAPYELINMAVKIGMRPFPAVFIASDASRIAMRCSALYCASKAALVQLVKTMTRELAGKGWRFNCVSPTLVENTQMTRNIWSWLKAGRGWNEEQCLREAVQSIPEGRPVTAAEVAQLILFLLGPNAAMINGSDYEITGGK